MASIGASLVLALVLSSATARSTPQPATSAHFVGVVVDEPTWPDAAVDLPAQLTRMVTSGVESVHVIFDWAQAQPYRSWGEVPAGERGRYQNMGGIPTDFSELDRLVGLAVERRLTVFPEVLDAPGWDAQGYSGAVVTLPRSPAPYGAFVSALVSRYGSSGMFWPAHRSLPRLPITMWQIWNEPDLPAFWPAQPFATRYVALLRAAHQAIKSRDPRAQVVLGGLTNYSWIDLARIYQVRGARPLFDAVAAHPYTRTPAGVMTVLGYVRTVMNRAGDRGKPLIADEVGWPSARGQTHLAAGQDFATTPAGQAHNIARLLPLLAGARQRLGLRAFYYYNWAGFERRGGFLFQFSGLFRFASGRFVAKPAFAAFRAAALAIERCRAKGAVATSCRR
jgi:hypothetical protein